MLSNHLKISSLGKTTFDYKTLLIMPNMGQAERIVLMADVFVIIGTSLQVYPAAYLKEKVAWMIPCFIIDPGEFWADDMYGFEHIKTTAVAGIDILKEKLKTL